MHVHTCDKIQMTYVPKDNTNPTKESSPDRLRDMADVHCPP